LFVCFYLGLFNANNGFAPSEVTKIILHDWGHVLIYLDGPVNTSENCSSKGALVLNRSNQHFTEMYSAALSAYHASTLIGGWVNGCDSKHNAPILTRLDLMPK
jgi:hypothetical protein